MGWNEELHLTPADLARLPAPARGAVAAFLVGWGYYADAVDVLRRLRAEQPENAALAARLVEALVAVGAVTDAHAVSEELVSHRPGGPLALVARADALLGAGRTDAAAECCRELLGAGARSLALERLARCRLAAGELRPALAAAEQALALVPEGSPRGPALRVLDQVLRRLPEEAARAAEVRQEMIRAHAEDLERLRRVVGPPSSPKPGGASRCGPPNSPEPGGDGSAPAELRGTGSHGGSPSPGVPGRDGEGETLSEPAALGAPDMKSGAPGLRPGVLADAGARSRPAGRPSEGSERRILYAPGGPDGEAPGDRVADGGTPPSYVLRPPSSGDLREPLRRIFGHDDFRPGQRQIVERVLAGESLLAVMPTGAGKSLCYQLPAALLPGATVVISPLIALMKDQVEGLPPALGERATVINSALEFGEVDRRLRDVAAGRTRLVYAAPERLRQWPFLDALRRARLSLFVIDEAHCLSLWGHDFRPDYLFLGPTLRRLGDPQVLAMTATASPTVRREVGERLGRDLQVVSLGVSRPNLRLEVIRAANDEEKLPILLSLCREQAGAVVVYANARERCEDLARMLRRRDVQAQHYHAGIEREERAAVQDAFMQGQVRVIVATVAFGMGVDKRDVRLVVHYNLPRSVESYYQEAGRAGRDGLPSRCVLLATPGDRGNLTRWMRQERIRVELLRDVYHAARRAAGAGRVARVSAEDLARGAGCDDETQIRVALSLLEQVGLVKRHLDLPRAFTLSFSAAPDDLELRALVQAAGLRAGQRASLDPLALAAASGIAPGEVEGVLLAGQARGAVECRAVARELLVEIPPPPAGALAVLERLLADHEEQDARRVERMDAYVKARSCRHAYIAQQFGEQAPRRCPACDNCAAGPSAAKAPAKARPRAAPAAEKPPIPDSPEAVVLQCLARLPFAVGKKGLVNILKGSLAASITAARCPQHGALAGMSRAAIERLADGLLERGLLVRDESGEFPLLRLSAQGRAAASAGSPAGD